MSGKRRNSRLTQNGKTITCTVDNSVLLVVSRLSSYSSSILSSTSRSKDQSNYFRKLWTLLDPVTTNWQACTRETDADRSWQAGHGETVNQQTRWTRKMQRKAFLFGYSPSQSIWRTWRRMCSHIPLKERTQIRKVMLQKWRHTNGSTEVMLISAKTKIDLFCEQTSMVTWKQQSTKVSTKDVIFGNNHRYAAVVQVLNGIRAKPKLHKTRRRITKVPKAVAEAKSFSYVQFIKIWQVLWRITMESSNNNTSSIRDKRNCRTSCTSNKRRDISRIIAISIGW